jgi:hypothetical protein
MQVPDHGACRWKQSVNCWEVIYKSCWIALAVLAVLIVICIFAPHLHKYKDMQSKYSEASDNKLKVETDIGDLQNKQQRLGTDTNFLKDTAHSIGMVETNETEYRLTNNRPFDMHSESR